MKQRKLGSSDLTFGVIALGTYQTFHQGVDAQTSVACLETALDLGITFFDTADTYGNGDAEAFLGDFFRGKPRDRFLVGTKCFFPTSPDPGDRGLGRRHIRASVETSLRRLRIDRIDLMQCHRFDPDTALEETIAAMAELIREGKIRHWGVSRWSSAQIDRARHIATGMGAPPPVSEQPPYNLFNRAAEQDVLAAAARLEIGIIVYSPLAQGVLTGKYDGASAPANSRASDPVKARSMWDFNEANRRKAVQFSNLAREAGFTPAQLALAWCLRKPEVTGVITGATRPEQIIENAAAAEMAITESLLARIGSVFNT